MSELPDCVYFDLYLKNYSNSNETKTPVRFYEPRQSNIIDDCSQYNLSIVRFNVNSSCLPVYQAEILPGETQSNADLMMASLSMEIYRGNAGSTVYSTGPINLFWVPQDLSISKPDPPSANKSRGNIQSNSDYYYCYNYDHLLKIVNTAFQTATTMFSEFDEYFAKMPAPFLTWDIASQSAILICKQNTFSTDRIYPSTEGDKEVFVKIYFNRSLYNLFSTFYFIKQNGLSVQKYTGRSYNELEMDYQLMVDSFYDTNALQLSNSNVQPLNRYLAIKQMESTVAAINCVASIMFLSDAIPILSSNQNKPTILFNNSTVNYQHSGLQDSYANVISDFSPDSIVRSNLYYVPTGSNRYISLTSNRQSLRTIDLTVMWADTWGQLHPFFLQSGASASVKILFEKKKLL